jgi:hypothetical protein
MWCWNAIFRLLSCGITGLGGLLWAVKIHFPWMTKCAPCWVALAQYCSPLGGDALNIHKWQGGVRRGGFLVNLLVLVWYQLLEHTSWCLYEVFCFFFHTMLILMLGTFKNFHSNLVLVWDPRFFWYLIPTLIPVSNGSIYQLMTNTGSYIGTREESYIYFLIGFTFL